jgi:hypothetical protein
MVFRPLILTSLLALGACAPPPTSFDPPPLLQGADRATSPLLEHGVVDDPGWVVSDGRLTSTDLDLQARLDGDGVTLGSADGTPRIELGLMAWGRDKLSAPAAGRRDGLTVHHGDVRQFWRTSGSFIEFGFVIEAASGPGDLRVDLAVHRVRVDGDEATLIGADGDEVDLLGLRAWDADGQELDAAFEPLEDGLRLRVDLGDARFPITIDPLLDSPSWTATGPTLSRFGSALVGGDWNGDGVADLAVGAPRTTDSHWREGAVHVFWGPGFGGVPDAVLLGGQAGARFGSSLASADIDGDGLDELVVGAPGWTDGQLEEGRVVVYSGLTEVFSWESDTRLAWAGSSVAAAPSKLLVGAPGWTGSAWLEGAAFGWTTLGGGPSWTMSGGARLAFLGRSVALGDVDGDGLDDAIAGSPGWRQTRYGEGAVRVAGGVAGGFGPESWSAFGSQRGAAMGRSVAVVDGAVVAGAPGWNGAKWDEGAAFAWDGLGSMPSWSMRSDQAFARLGRAVAGGDLNADGRSELLLGAPRWDGDLTNEGAVFAVLGEEGGWAADAAWSATGGQAHAAFGGALAAVGDLDGDGFGDAVVGASLWDGSTWNEGQASLFAGTWTDLDGDGDPTHTDCDDDDPALNHLDVDLDGYDSCSSPLDCDDSTPQVAPDAPEACDGQDNDCDGLVDADDPDFDSDVDGDGYLTEGCGVGGEDCDDNDGHAFPDARQTSGPISLCEPAASPGFEGQWHWARLSEANYFFDPESGEHFLYFRGHADQAVQAIGVANSTDGMTWTEPTGPVLSGGGPGAWDEQNTSNPAIVYLEGAQRPYVMLYHAKDTATGTRAVGLASATSAWGPFERLSPIDESPITAPVLAPSTDPTFGDSFRTLHPAAWLDPDSGVLHLWYNGRTATDSTLNIFGATSTDAGQTWIRTDVDGVPGPDVIWGPTEAWHGTRVTQPSVLEDPMGDGLLFWFTGDQAAIGAASGDVTEWTANIDGPAFGAAPDCSRFDGAAVTARGMRHDDIDDVFHWYYTARTDLAACPDNDDPWFDNPWDQVSYVGHAVNPAPVVDGEVLDAGLVVGTVADTFPEGVIVTVTSDVDGYLGSAMVDVGVGDGIVEVDWSLTVDPPLSSGVHALVVDAVDEGGVVRSVELGVVVP